MSRVSSGVGGVGGVNGVDRLVSGTSRVLSATLCRSHQVGGPAHRVENLVEKDKNPEEWWPWKLDPRNGHCATPSQWSRRKSREISGIVIENTRF